jgi:hypothetical protein
LVRFPVNVILSGGTTAGEYDDIDVGVVFLLLQTPGESVNIVDGLLMELTEAGGADMAFAVTAAAARACSSGMSCGGRSSGLLDICLEGGTTLGLGGFCESDLTPLMGAIVCEGLSSIG